MNTNKNRYLLAYTLSFLSLSAYCLFPELSFANTGFGDIGNNITENSKGVAEALKFLGYTAGMGFVVWGCFDLYGATNGRGNSTYASGLIKILIASLLLAAPSVIGSSSTTIFGTDQTTGLGELGL